MDLARVEAAVSVATHLGAAISKNPDGTLTITKPDHADGMVPQAASDAEADVPSLMDKAHEHRSEGSTKRVPLHSPARIRRIPLTRDQRRAWARGTSSESLTVTWCYAK